MIYVASYQSREVIPVMILVCKQSQYVIFNEMYMICNESKLHTLFVSILNDIAKNCGFHTRSKINIVVIIY